MKISRKTLIINVIVAALFVAILIGVSYWPYHEYAGLKMHPELDIADNIMISPTDQLFATSLYNLGYSTFLHQNGPFTVFLPADTGFQNFSPEMKYFLGQNENSGSIRQLLLYHIVAGKYMYSDLRDGMELPTIEGDNLKITKRGNYFYINDVAYIQTYDIQAKNGVIHIISNYLVPPSLLGQ